MKKSKLLDVFRALEAREWRPFEDFLHSPYFNKKEEVSRLGEHLLLAARRGFPEKMLEQEAIMNAAFPEDQAGEKQLAYAMSDLLKLCEQFLSWRAIEEEGLTVSLYHLRTCQSRDLEKSYKRTYNNCRKELLDDGLESQTRLWQRYQLCQIAEDKFAAKGLRTTDPYLQEAADRLDIYYLTQKLKLSCAMIARQTALNEQYAIRVLSQEVLQQIDHLPENSLARLYAQSYSLLQTDNDEAALQGLWNSLIEQQQAIAPEEVTELFHHTVTYCIQQIRKGFRQFTTQLLNIYQEGLARGFLLEEGVLSPWNYKNIVKLGLGLRRFDWVDLIIRQYTDVLPEDQREDAFHYNMADLQYHRQNYDQAFFHLNKVEFTDIHYILGSKTMLVKIYFETDETEALLALLSSFSIYLKRNRLIANNIRLAYKNFLNFTNKLLKATADHQDQLLADIRHTVSLSDRSWLLVQAQKLGVAQ